MRQILEYAKMAFRNIIINKMRSILTMLGIIIGISSVIIVLGVGMGGQAQISDELNSIANGAIYVYAGGEDVSSGDLITQADLNAIENLPSVSAVTVQSGTSGTVIGPRNEEIAASISAGTEDMNTVVPSSLVSGRTWDASDYTSARHVVTIDSLGAKELFGSDNVVGLTVQMKVMGRTGDFTIIGVVENTQPSFGDVTAQISMPLSTLLSFTGSDSFGEPYYQIAYLPTSPEVKDQSISDVTTLLSQRHNNAEREIYQAMDLSAFADQFNTIIGMFSTIIACIAAISLLVGGIGVMNIMLVSVTERTREIGIRKALGAKTGTILFQFLVESATLTLLGGVIGLVVGILGGYLVGNLLNVPPVISPAVVIGVVLFSSAIGIFFGIYPARKAARLNPIEALRSE